MRRPVRLGLDVVFTVIQFVTAPALAERDVRAADAPGADEGERLWLWDLQAGLAAAESVRRRVEVLAQRAAIAGGEACR